MNKTCNDPEHIDLTPTWQSIMPMLISVVQDGAPKGRKNAVEEIMRLAASVDKRNSKTNENFQGIADMLTQALHLMLQLTKKNGPNIKPEKVKEVYQCVWNVEAMLVDMGLI